MCCICQQLVQPLLRDGGWQGDKEVGRVEPESSDAGAACAEADEDIASASCQVWQPYHMQFLHVLRQFCAVKRSRKVGYTLHCLVVVWPDTLALHANGKISSANTCCAL